MYLFVIPSFKDDWKARLKKIDSFLKEKGIITHYFKNGVKDTAKDAIAIDYSEGDNAKIIEELYEASEKALEKEKGQRSR